MVLEKKLAYIFFYFKLFLCPPDVKTLNFSRVLLSWTPTRAPAWIYCKAYRTLRPSLGFYSMQKLNLCSKTDISKTAWINACQGMLMHPATGRNSHYIDTGFMQTWKLRKSVSFSSSFLYILLKLFHQSIVKLQNYKFLQFL